MKKIVGRNEPKKLKIKKTSHQYEFFFFFLRKVGDRIKGKPK